jgi:phosphatidylinositol alpha-1,6-mannosyltransferase
MHHLLVTNDFPPKVGGIQSYLWELWRRLDPTSFTVLTTPHSEAATWDTDQSFRVERATERVLLPTRNLTGRIDALADEVGADLVLLDPALPLGHLGPGLQRPYGVVVHGAEVTVPGRLPGVQLDLRRTLRGASLVVAAGHYPADEARRAAGRELPVVVVPPGVDTDRFVPLTAEERWAARDHFGLDPATPLVVSVSRLVPRKGMDVLIRAVARVADRLPEVTLAIAGHGRDRGRLERVAQRHGAPTRFLGRVDDDQLPLLYGCADAFAMLCRNRWLGLEQEGFGIVFLEAAACGVPQVAGASGGSAEAVEHDGTGFVIDPAGDAVGAAAALKRILTEPELARELSDASRRRAVADYSYDRLARDLEAGLAAWAP